LIGDARVISAVTRVFNALKPAHDVVSAVDNQQHIGRTPMAKALILALGLLAAFAIGPAVAQQAPRVPLVQDDTSDPDAAANLKAIAARGIKPHDIHRVYANAPKLQRRSSALAQAIRNDATVPRADRELIILRATQLMRGDYQFTQHRTMAISCGMTAEQVDNLPRWRESGLFNDRERAVLAYADGMVGVEGVDDATFAAMKRFFSTKEIVELTMTASYYNGSAQATRALGVQPEKSPDPSGYGKC
jgi:alkylhydroperoxidase family enzyme